MPSLGNLISLDTFQTQIVAPLETRGIGVYDRQFLIEGNSILSSIFVESMDEHKSYNLIALDNGQFALQPNNRCQFFDAALNPSEIKFPDFKVATTKYKVEDKAKWRLGDTTDVTYDGRGE